MRRQAFTWVDIAVTFGILCIVLVVMFPVFVNWRDTKPRRPMCQAQLKQIALRFKMYIQDADERYPLASQKQGWYGAIQPYSDTTDIFHCPQEELRGYANLTDYWYNRRMAGVSEGEFIFVANTIMMGDGEASHDPKVSFDNLPEKWRKESVSPAHRHLEGANYAYADGHVKWLRPEKVTVTKPTALVSTFRPF